MMPRFFPACYRRRQPVRSPSMPCGCPQTVVFCSWREFSAASAPPILLARCDRGVRRSPERFMFGLAEMISLPRLAHRAELRDNDCVALACHPAFRRGKPAARALLQLFSQPDHAPPSRPALSERAQRISALPSSYSAQLVDGLGGSAHSDIPDRVMRAMQPSAVPRPLRQPLLPADPQSPGHPALDASRGILTALRRAAPGRPVLRHIAKPSGPCWPRVRSWRADHLLRPCPVDHLRANRGRYLFSRRQPVPPIESP